MPLSKWYLFIQKAVQIMNKKTKLANFNPPQLAKYYTNNRMKYNFIGLPEEEFKFSIGDPINLKSSSTASGRAAQNKPGFKRSIGEKLTDM